VKEGGTDPGIRNGGLKEAVDLLALLFEILADIHVLSCVEGIELGWSGKMRREPIKRGFGVSNEWTGPPTACLPQGGFAILRRMSIRKAGGEWESMLLGIKPRTCKVCGKGLYRDMTLLKGGWSRCSRCDEFVHYSCLASGRSGIFKARPRVCQACQVSLAAAQGPAGPMSAVPS
jgi:hypothetical protein